MNVVVTKMSSSVNYAYSDDSIVKVFRDLSYDIDFIIAKDNKVTEYSTNIRRVGDLSFAEAERIIKDLLN